MSTSEESVDDELVRVFRAFPLPECRNLRLFVTGGTGFLGYWLLSALDFLNARGREIEVVALSRSPEGFIGRHPVFKMCKWLSWQHGDIETYDFPSGQFSAIIHGATESSADAAKDPLKLFSSIANGTRRVLDHALLCEAQRVLLIGSGAVYGPQPEVCWPISEETLFRSSPKDLQNIYGEGKRVMETLGCCYQEQFGLNTVVARLFSFLGPHLPPHLAAGQFIRNAMAGKKITIVGDGTPVRSYLHPADMAFWILALLLRGKAGEAYNAGSDQGISLLALAQTIKAELAPDTQIIVQNNSAHNFRPLYTPDITKIKAETGVDIWTNLHQSIRSYATWHQARN